LGLSVTAILGGTIAPAGGQEARTLEQVYQIDERGDAKIDWTFELNAKQWAIWKANYGDHPDLLLRIVKHQLAASVIDDYQLEKDEMHRRGVSKFKARALARYRGDGRFEIDVPKTLKMVTGSGTDWAFTGSQSEAEGILNVTYRAKLPASARNVHFTTGNDVNRLVYELDVTPSRPKTLLYLGILLLLAAAGVGVAAFRQPAPATAVSV
jgi:hypothetical protein